MKKNKVYFFRKGCVPRVFINPSEQAIKDMREKGTVLINPITNLLKQNPIHHTYPDVEKNILRLLPESERKQLSELNNPMEVARRESDAEIKEAMMYIKTQKLREFSYMAKIDDEMDDLYCSTLAELAIQSAEYDKELKLRDKRLLCYIVVSNLIYLSIYKQNAIIKLLQEVHLWLLRTM